MTITPASINITMTSAPNFQAIENAWRLSRPNESEFDLADVLKIDVPVNEFADMILEIEAPILIREILCTLREHVVWARTSRVDDLSTWPIWHGVANHERILRNKAEFDRATTDQDRKRLALPLSYVTGFSLKLNLRTYLKLIKMFERMALSWKYDETAKALFREMHNELAKQLAFMEYSSTLKRILEHNIYQPLELMRFYPKQDNGVTVEGDMILLTLRSVPIALRAQVVRHRPILFNDNFEQYLNMDGLACTINHPVAMSLAMTTNTALGLVKKRNCWIAQTDLWQQIVNMLNEVVEGELQLPCDTGACPFERDNRLRIEGKDPNPPCPRFASLNKEWLNDPQALAAMTYANQRPASGFWMYEISKGHKVKL